MRHGFKAKAERLAGAARDKLGLAPTAPLDCYRYAEHLGVLLLSFDELQLSPQAKKQLLVVDPESWSGMTIKANGVTAILVNPTHSPERLCNTVTHELSHVILAHVATRVDVGPEGILLVSEYSEDDEDEADWLAGALLLPRNALMECRSSGLNNSQIAKRFGVSIQLCDWRTRMTGIDVQLRRAGAR